MKLFILMFITTFSFFSFSYHPGDHDFVKNDRLIEAFGEHIVKRDCEKTNDIEVLALCNGATLSTSQAINIINSVTKETQDNLLEEEIFKNLAQKAHFGADCMEKVSTELLNDTQQKAALSNHVNQSWDDIKETAQQLVANYDQIKREASSYALSMSSPGPAHDIFANQKTLNKLDNEVKKKKELIETLFQSLPFADEYQFNKQYWKLARKKKMKKPASHYFNKTLKKVNKAAIKNNKKYNKKKRVNDHYQLGHGDKRRLYRFFSSDLLNDQTNRTTKNKDIVEAGLLCRMDGRYNKGPKVLTGIVDGAMLVGSVFTFGLTGALGATVKAAWSVKTLRSAKTLTALAAATTGVDLVHAVNSCSKTLPAPDFKINQPKPTCSVSHTISFQMAKRGYGQCAFNALVASVPVVLNGVTIKAIKENFAKVRPANRLADFKSANTEKLMNEYYEFGKKIEADRAAYKKLTSKNGSNNPELLSAAKAEERLIKELEELDELAVISKLDKETGMRRLEDIRNKQTFSVPAVKPELRWEQIQGIEKLAPNMRRGIEAAGKKLADSRKFYDFLEQIKADAFLITVRNANKTQNPKLLEMVKKGETDPEAIKQVLEHRTAELGLPIVDMPHRPKMNMIEKEQEKLFLDNLSKGVLSDGPQKKFFHGMYPHWLQEIYTVKSFQNAAGLESTKEVLDFYKTKTGQEYFRKIKDQVGSLTLMSPEGVSKLLNELEGFKSLRN